MSLPYLTADLPGIGGDLKVAPEDFLVEEVPAYEPCGSGEHLYLWVEKRDLAADQLTRTLTHAFQIDPRDLGMAGLKDRRAVTRQWISVPANAETHLAAFEHPQISILKTSRHRNKLKTGHLHGNRFTVRLRNVPAGMLPRAEAIAEVLRVSGAPNYYGDQRFGHDRSTLSMGHDLLAGRRTPQDLPHNRRRFLLRLSLSAVQSELFNQCLAERIRDGLFSTVLTGDLMCVLPGGGQFFAEDLPTEQQRFDARETSITGPMFGVEMRSPHGLPAEREARILNAASVTLDQMHEYRQLLPGTRRPFRMLAQDLAIHHEGSMLTLSCRLPAGAYVTVLLRELQKIPDASPAGDEEACATNDATNELS